MKELKPWTVWHRRLCELERLFESCVAFAGSPHLDESRRAQAEGHAYGTVFLISEMHYDGPAGARREGQE